VGNQPLLRARERLGALRAVVRYKSPFRLGERQPRLELFAYIEQGFGRLKQQANRLDAVVSSGIKWRSLHVHLSIPEDAGSLARSGSGSGCADLSERSMVLSSRFNAPVVFSSRRLGAGCRIHVPADLKKVRRRPGQHLPLTKAVR